MGCVQSSSVDEKTNKYSNDKKWQELASWGKDLGLNSWGEEIVAMKSIHPRLFMGSRLSAQVVIDKGKLHDQDGNIYPTRGFHVVCVASAKTCEYCELSTNFKKYDIQDRNNQSDDFVEIAMETARHMHKKLKKHNHVLVHCHSGRNRSALAVLVYAAMYTQLSYEDALYKIRRDNSSRFSMQSTLQNNAFTAAINTQWLDLRKKA